MPSGLQHSLLEPKLFHGLGFSPFARWLPTGFKGQGAGRGVITGWLPPSNKRLSSCQLVISR